MSDSDDGFDREAERRKLEEKYGDDTERRQSTQRMSDLLLKGATMTNRHCDTCGDPIFRQDSQEFCPTCSAADGQGAGDADGQQPDDADAGRGEASATDASAPAAREPQPAANGRAPPEAAGDGDPTAPGAAGGQPERPQGGAEGAPRERRGETAAGAPQDRRGEAAAGGDLAAARAALTDAVAAHATRGAEATDPRTAADHLAAAREAAEALSALRR